MAGVCRFRCMFAAMVVVAVVAFDSASGKIYERCELARELKNKHNAPMDQLGTWVCIAKHESSYNTKAVNNNNSNGSSDFGIFQINNKYWCSPPGTGCGLKCSDLLDDNIADDFKCAQRIRKKHAAISGDGFKAWSVYVKHCKGRGDEYIKDCFKSSVCGTVY